VLDPNKYDDQALVKITPPKAVGGLVFDAHDGSLYVNLCDQIGTLLHLTSWQDGLQLYRAVDERGDSWERVEYDLGIPLLLWAESNAGTPDAAAAKQFVESIPPAIRDIARPFVWRHCILLRLLRIEPMAASIVADNPVLAWLLVDWLAEAEMHPSCVHHLLLGPRTTILSQVSGMTSQGVVKLLSRIRFERYESAGLETVRRFIDRGVPQEKLAQVRRLSGPMLMHVLRRPTALLFPVWRRLAEECDKQHTAETIAVVESAISRIRDIESMAVQLAVRAPVMAYRGCTTMDALGHLHDRWTARINERRTVDAVDRLVGLYGTAVFPEPPVPGTDTIRPIRTQQELSEEGALMHHCVAVYGDRVMRKRSYIYAVHAPERATLEVDVEDLIIEQLRCACNAAASPETYRAVQEWLNANRKHEGTRGKKQD